MGTPCRPAPSKSDKTLTSLLNPTFEVGAGSFVSEGKYILQCQQIFFFNVDKYILLFGQIYFAVWTNIFCYLNKYSLQYGQIQGVYELKDGEGGTHYALCHRHSLNLLYKAHQPTCYENSIWTKFVL